MPVGLSSSLLTVTRWLVSELSLQVLGQSPAWVTWCGWAEDAATRHHHPRGRAERRDGELDADTGSPLYSSGFCHDCPVIAILSSCLLLRCPTAWLITAAGCGLAATRRIINPMTLTNTVPRPASCHPQAHRTGHQGRGRPQMTLLIIL